MGVSSFNKLVNRTLLVTEKIPQNVKLNFAGEESRLEDLSGDWGDESQGKFKIPAAVVLRTFWTRWRARSSARYLAGHGVSRAPAGRMQVSLNCNRPTFHLANPNTRLRPPQRTKCIQSCTTLSFHYVITSSLYKTGYGKYKSVGSYTARVTYFIFTCRTLQQIRTTSSTKDSY